MGERAGNTESLPLEWRMTDEAGNDITPKLWTPPPKAKSLNVIYDHDDATAKGAREAFDRKLEGRTCSHCKWWANDPNDREAQGAKREAWKILTKDLGFANQHFNPDNYGACVLDYQFTTPDAYCEDWKGKSTIRSFVTGSISSALAKVAGKR